MVSMSRRTFAIGLIVSSYLNIDSSDKNSNIASTENNTDTKQGNNELVIDDVDEEPLFDDEWW